MAFDTCSARRKDSSVVSVSTLSSGTNLEEALELLSVNTSDDNTTCYFSNSHQRPLSNSLPQDGKDLTWKRMKVERHPASFPADQHLSLQSHQIQRVKGDTTFSRRISEPVNPLSTSAMQHLQLNNFVVVKGMLGWGICKDLTTY
jgi:hypothetical protein